ncbi:MAG: secondary thiamine-phosphate synthase enzyme YjbQ [Gammaproteobacteria bacterium]|nr:secondary thiamine-phosphate synthase enzyme YjbQ [Gammaproteobacteria bacterium]
MIRRLSVATGGQGLHEITAAVQSVVRDEGVNEGLCTIFVQHTSASLMVQENADPAVRQDLEQWLKRLVPERDAIYTHNSEGDDDMPAHIKSALTASSISIPIMDGSLGLGAWQGIYLWEHRRGRRSRQVLVHVQD